MIINESHEHLTLDRSDFGPPGPDEYDFAIKRNSPTINNLNGECIGNWEIDQSQIERRRNLMHGYLYRLRFPSETAVLAFYMTHSDYVIWFRN